VISKVLVRKFPDRFQLEGTLLSNIATGEKFDLADQDRNPMDVVARIVQVTRLLHNMCYIAYDIRVERHM